MSSTSMNGRKPRMMEHTSILPLPHDMVLSCLAHISRLYYPTLSLVSKSFRCLLASPELYKARSLLNRTESCLYVCLQFPTDPNPRWFTLCKKPNQKALTLTENKEEETEKSSGYVLVPIRTLNSALVEWSNLIAVDYNLYAITEESPPCSNVSFLDCRTHTWLEAPSMRIAQTNSKFDGKLYLPTNHENQDSSLNCIEVFNTKTQTWKPVPSEKRIFKPRYMEGKIYVNLTSKSGYALDLKELTGEPVGFMDLVTIEKIKYCYNINGEFEWNKFTSHVSRKLKGLEGLPKFAVSNNVKLVSYGGKIMVLWDEDMPTSEYNKEEEEEEKIIWCAEISLEKRNKSEEIWGKVEWSDAVLKVPKSYKFVYAITATI